MAMTTQFLALLTLLCASIPTLVAAADPVTAGPFVVEPPTLQPTATAEVPAEEAGAPTLMILIVGVVVLGAAGAGAFFVLRGRGLLPPTSPADDSAPTVPASPLAEGAAPAPEGESDTPEAAEEERPS